MILDDWNECLMLKRKECSARSLDRESERPVRGRESSGCGAVMRSEFLEEGSEHII